MSKAAIIFDMDGTILDTETPDYETWRELYAAHGVDLPFDLWKQRIGVVYQFENAVFDPASHFERLTGITLGTETRREQYERYVARCRLQEPLPGVKALIEAARQSGVPLGIASNSDRGWVEHWLAHLDLLASFGCVSTFEEVPQPKPAPDVYLSAAACLGVPPERCIAIEDSPIGMEAALAAGMRCVAVPNTLTAHLLRPGGISLTPTSLAETSLGELLALVD
jgi:HAD superfamily hydrolase (TIGR01509 family)